MKVLDIKSTIFLVVLLVITNVKASNNKLSELDSARAANDLEFAEKLVKAEMPKKAISYFKAAAVLYLAAEQGDKAKEVYMRALEITEENEDYKHGAEVAVGLARITEQEGQHSLAEKYYKMSLEQKKQIHDFRQILKGSNTLADFYVRIQQYGNAYETLQMVETISLENNDVEELAACYTKLSEIYDQQGLTDMSEAYYDLFMYAVGMDASSDISEITAFREERLSQL